MIIVKLIFLVMVGYSYNSYFGWNWAPGSDAEMVCDMIFVLIAIQLFASEVQ